jgi:hypothetical protein
MFKEVHMTIGFGFGVIGCICFCISTTICKLTPYLSHAELRLFKRNKKIGYAEYHITGGSMSLS